MKALVYHGPGHRAWEEKPAPALQQPTDDLVRLTTTTICGTDLHILKGDVPEVPLGLTLGHEGVGVVTAVGSAVSAFKTGDRVLISCITSCGKCESCRRGMYSHCADGGWQLGHLIDGTQAEQVRIPHADGSLHLIPPGVADDDPLGMLSDILPTGSECGVLNGVIKSMVFGVVATWIAVFEGYDAVPTSEGVSRATTRTVVHTALAVLGLDFVLTALMFGTN